MGAAELPWGLLPAAPGLHGALGFYAVGARQEGSAVLQADLSSCPNPRIVWTLDFFFQSFGSCSKIALPGVFRKHVSRPYLQFPCKKEKRGEGGRISCRGNAACWRKSNLPRERGAAAEETCEICPLSASSAAPVGARPAVKRWALIVRGIHGKAGIRPRNKTSTGETSHLLRDLFSLRSCSG